jgi:hypothetical protein
LAGLLYSRQAHRLTDKDTIVLADFANSRQAMPIFDDTLKTALSVVPAAVALPECALRQPIGRL